MSFLSNMDKCTSPQKLSTNSCTLLFSSTSFRHKLLDVNQIGTETDVYIDETGVTLHRVNSELIAQLNFKRNMIELTHKKGFIDEGLVLATNKSFQHIYEHGCSIFGSEEVNKVIESFDEKSFLLSSDTEPDLADIGFSKTSITIPDKNEPKFSTKLTFTAVRKVDTIEKEALEKGWTIPELYQNKGKHPFPVGGSYGLACFIDTNRLVGEVTENSIEIQIFNAKPTQTHSLRFYKKYRKL